MRQRPRVSVFSVALRHEINANVFRKRLPPKRNTLGHLPAFVLETLTLRGMASDRGRYYACRFDMLTW